MTTTTSLSHANDTRNWPVFAAAAAGLSAVLTAIGTFWSPLANYEATQSREDFFSWLFVVGVIAVATSIVFGLVVRTARPERTDRRGLILAVLSVLTIVVFWAGLPVVLAGGAACLALSNNPMSTTGKITLALAVLVTGGAVWLALAG
jgi:predicted MFS family arabinose efflux permease